MLWNWPPGGATPARCWPPCSAVAALALLTRGLHLDGLADLADGLGSRQPADAALAIMKRSDIGPFGVVTLVLTLLVQVAALAQAEALGRGVPAVIAAVGGRAAGADLGLPPRRSGRARAAAWARWWPGRFPPRSRSRSRVGGTGGGRTRSGSFCGRAWPRGWPSRSALTALAVRRLGGITGDVLGALVEVTAAVCLLVDRAQLAGLAAPRAAAGVAGRLVVVGVLGARPEEAAQAVALGPGHHVHVQVRRRSG